MSERSERAFARVESTGMTCDRSRSKKHHIKFFPTRETGVDGSGNVPPGFVVDEGLTRKGAYDFYMTGYPGIQGTSTPCYYRVILDEVHLTEDALKGITLALHFACVPPSRARAILLCDETRGVAQVHQVQPRGQGDRALLPRAADRGAPPQLHRRGAPPRLQREPRAPGYSQARRFHRGVSSQFDLGASRIIAHPDMLARGGLIAA